MCEHDECKHSLGPSSHCTECDRLERTERKYKPVTDAFTRIMEPVNRAELMAAADEAFKTIPSPTSLEEYGYSWRFCEMCRKFSALSKKWGQPYVCPCGYVSQSEKK